MAVQIPQIDIHTPPSDVRLARLSVEKYHQMIEAGILTTNDRVELIEGWLVEKMTKGTIHSAVTGILGELLQVMLPDDWFVRLQEPITTADSEPEPDVAVVGGIRQDYFFAHPTPDKIALIIEVADSSLKFDKGDKKRVYANAGIAIYAVLNLIDRQLEVYSKPADSDYQETVIYTENDEFPIILDGQERGKISVKSVLP